MTPPNRLSYALQELVFVCDLLESPVISPDTLFYLAQLREVLGNEVEQLEKEGQLRSAA